MLLDILQRKPQITTSGNAIVQNAFHLLRVLDALFGNDIAHEHAATASRLQNAIGHQAQIRLVDRVVVDRHFLCQAADGGPFVPGLKISRAYEMHDALTQLHP